MRVIFTLASGRSGTRFLADLFRRNVSCVGRHEPYFDRGNPSMFGRPIYDRAVGDVDAVRRLARRKRAWIERRGGPLYVETSHAFLKSWWDLAPELFADWNLIHLIRDPRKVARSEANRHEFADRWRLPFRHYRAGGERFFRWALTGREPIFSSFEPGELTLFQWYVVQWIEIENRAVRLLSEHKKHNECVTLDSPGDLNNPQLVREMFHSLGISPRRDPPLLAGNQNRTPRRPTVLSEADEQQFSAVIARVPETHLSIFRERPYTAFSWAASLRRRG
jgi:hypothetical protein